MSGLGERPVRLPPSDLSGVFAPPQPVNRASSLAGKLASRPAPEPTAPGPSPDVDPPHQAIKPKTHKPRPVPEATPEPPPRPTSGTMRAVVVYLPISLRERLRNAEGDLSQTGVILMAINATHEQLRTLFTPTDTAAASLFRTPPSRRRRTPTEPLVQVTMRLPTDDIAIIDQMVQTTGAPGRSVFVTAALELYLTPNEGPGD